MKRYLFLITIVISCINYCFSQAIGEWKLHLAYYDATMAIPVGNLVYVLSDGCLYSYDTEDTSIRTYDKESILNDNGIAQIGYNNELKTLLIVYKNSNIDLLVNDKDLYNISEFMNKTMSVDKTLNNINIHNEYAYLSTKFGLVIVNLKKREITNSYNLEKEVYNSFFSNDIIYLATEDGIYTGDIKENLLDIKNWTLFNNTILKNITYFDNTIIGLDANSSVCSYNPSSDSFTEIDNGNYSFMNNSNGKLIIGNTNSILIFNDITSKTKITQEENFNNLTYHKNDTYWGSNGLYGLNSFKLNNNKLEKSIETILPHGPRRNYAFNLLYTDRLLVAGGEIFYDRSSKPGAIMEYKDNNWSYFEEGESITKKTGQNYLDITSVAQDPNDPEHIFATAGGEGLYEFNDKKYKNLYNIDNSILETIYPDRPSKYRYIRMNGLKYDKSGNLWMLNSFVEYPIKILKKNNEWIKYNTSDFKKIEVLGNISFDQRGWAWINAIYNKPGIFCLDTKNTLDISTDDQSIFYSKFTNQDGKEVIPEIFFCVTEDHNGEIWIGTSQGPIIIKNPTKIFESNSCYQIKVPRNDGTNNADLLLENEWARTICIDGANRKWIGTENSGVYLVSED